VRRWKPGDPIRVEADIQQDGSYKAEVIPDRCPRCARPAEGIQPPDERDENALEWLRPVVRYLPPPPFRMRPCGCPIPEGFQVRIYDPWPLDF
jgi:hypothetical protein